MTDIDPTLDPDSADAAASDDSDDGQEDDPIATLRAEIAERDERLNAALSQFSATVGRLQSLAAKPAKDTSAAEREEFQQAAQLIDLLIDGLDETSLPPEKRRQIEATREAARRKAERTTLKKEILAEIEPEETNEQDTYLADVRAFEDEIVEEITSYGLDAKDFDWAKGTEILVSRGKAETRAFFRTAILSALKQSQAETRLQTRKETGGKPTPKAAGAVLSDNDIINDPSIALKDRVAALRRMGAIR